MRRQGKKEKFYRKPRKKFVKQRKKLRNLIAVIPADISKFKAELRSKKKIPLDFGRYIRHFFNSSSKRSVVFFYLYIFTIFKLVVLIIKKKERFEVENLDKSSLLGFNYLKKISDSQIIAKSSVRKTIRMKRNQNTISSQLRKITLIGNRAVHFDRRFMNFDLVLDFREIISYMLHTKRRNIYKAERFFSKPFNKYVKIVAKKIAE